MNQLLGTVNYTYDALKRIRSKKTTGKEYLVNDVPTNYVFTRWFTYADDSSTHKGSTRVAQDVYRVGTQQNSGTVLHGQKYVYNTDGNIAEIQDLNGNPIAEYAYDSLGQLTEETIYTSSESSYTYLYTYDNAGNLLSRRVSGTTVEDVYQYTNTYWADLLTSFKGQTINYETATVSINGQTVTLRSGNPKNWYHKVDDTDVTFSNLKWAQGRQLVHAEKGSTQIDYTYDMEGVRSSKTVGTVTHNYVTQNGKVVRETWGNNVLWFVYDASGSPFSLLYSTNGGSSWATYYYILNLQGDVVKLVSATGTVAATYTYDAWGNPQSSTGTMASTNPLLYRGYYYDSETGFYYLQSRYYDPVVKRFLNADAYGSTGQGFLGYNMFAYCNNNPENMSDSGGGRPVWEGKHGERTDSGSSTPKTCGINPVLYDVPLYDQGKTNLCWAYCQVMVEDYFSGTVRTKAEAFKRAKEISTSVHRPDGVNWNTGGRPTNQGKAIMPTGIEQIYTNLVLTGGPLYARYTNEDGSLAHIIVITGIDLDHNLVYTNNPWNKAGPKTYEEFTEGFLDVLRLEKIYIPNR